MIKVITQGDMVRLIILIILTDLGAVGYVVVGPEPLPDRGSWIDLSYMTTDIFDSSIYLDGDETEEKLRRAEWQ